MDRETLRKHAWMNRLHSCLLILTACGVLGGLAWSLMGPMAGVVAVGFVVVLWFVTPRMSPALVLRRYRAVQLTPQQAPNLFAVTAQLARRAELPRTPALYYLPSDVMNAFTMGGQRNAIIAVSDGLLRRLPFAELAGVIAHEIAHVQAGDTRLMSFADMVGRLTGTIASIGKFLVLVNLPMFLFGQAPFGWWTVLLMVFAPSLVSLAQLALSRTREYDADRAAAELLGDPAPLASALQRLDVHHKNTLRRMASPVAKLPDPSLLRTHPRTKDRVARLGELGKRIRSNPIAAARRPVSAPTFLAAAPHRPRVHRTLTWF